MKLLVLALFVAAAAAAPIDDSNGPVELIVNGVPEGQALELGHIVDIKVKEHSNGEVIATNLLHPLTAVGIAEAAAAAVVETPVAEVLPEVAFPEAVVLPSPAHPEVMYPAVAGSFPLPATPDFVFPGAVVLPAPAQPEVVPEAVVLPSPTQPEVVPEAVVLPAPAQPEVVPEAVVLPAPAQPEVVPEAIVLPAPVAPEVALPESIPAPAAQLPNGEIFNDGNVQVTVNAENAGMMTSLQNWFSMILNYITDGTVQTTQQIV